MPLGGFGASGKRAESAGPGGLSRGKVRLRPFRQLADDFIGRSAERFDDRPGTIVIGDNRRRQALLGDDRAVTRDQTCIGFDA